VTAGAAAYGPAFARKADAFAQALDGLDAQRNAVDALKPTAPQAAAAYTGLIGEGLGMVRALSGAIGPVGIANHAASYAAFLTMKEYAGQERAAASAAFAAGSLDLAGIRRLATLQADQATYEGLFRSRAEPAQGALLDAAEATAPAREVARLRKVALETMPGEALAFRDAPLWFRLATQRIDGLKAVEDHLTADLAAEAGGVRATAERALAIWSGAALAIFLLSGALAFGLAPDPTVAITAAAAEGALMTLPAPALELARTLAQRVRDQGGALLVVDYGHVRPGFGDTLQAIAGHRFVGPLDAPGEADLTVHVDFPALARAAAEAGAAIHGPVDQRAFLDALGLPARAARLKARATPAQAEAIAAASLRLTDPAPGGMGSLFKAMAITQPTLPPPPGFAHG
ncbi:SAM-dependent methyltransferase, partial [Methylobacterium sp. WL116]|uniref:SAM-dependent methyltransferase n=1 Tax=Methylobacterium sp. WL116 TaxID=2603889 RepID=UPI0011DA962D